MQFESIILNNFMRYKGTNEIMFSCNPEKNVTVVLGDNTVGKTTIAQAFRWGLYGSLLIERGKKNEDYILLNKDVITLMDANSRGTVGVKIKILNEGKRYILNREITYKRVLPTMKISELTKSTTLKVGEISDDESCYVEIEEKNINEVISEMFPMDLSHYFLFDGEKWNDITVGGVKENIKESVHKLTGLSATSKALYHLKDMGSRSVISQMRGKIKGSGAIFDNLQRDIEKDEYTIEKLQEEISVLENNIAMEEKLAGEIDEFLSSNASTEATQKAYKEAEKMVTYLQNTLINPYKTFVNEFSNKAMSYFAEPMMQRCLYLVKQADMDRKDIPYMRQATIDYILQSGKCICGTSLIEGSKECQCLLEQRNYLPPADIGSLLAEFQRTSNHWRGDSNKFLPNIKENAEQVKAIHEEYENRYIDFQKMDQNLDRNIDFAQKRKELRDCNNRMRAYSVEAGNKKGRVETLKSHIESLNSQISVMQTKSAENERWRERLNVAEELYKTFSEEYKKQEQKTFLTLNQKIQENFQKMFNAKDKKIELDKYYNINMLYSTGIGYAEEKNLSEGEKVARNFAFIATIMSYEKEQKEEGDENVDTLPIILDAPFSKLGQENIELVAQALPGIAEQVIIFMLDKDWDYTKLDDYVGAKYVIEKHLDKNYAAIKKMEGESHGSNTL